MSDVEERSRTVRKAIALVDQIREEVRGELVGHFAEERAELTRLRNEIEAQRDQAIREAHEAGRAAERADVLAHLRAHKGAWERASQSIAAGAHVGKGAS